MFICFLLPDFLARVLFRVKSLSLFPRDFPSFITESYESWSSHSFLQTTIVGNPLSTFVSPPCFPLGTSNLQAELKLFLKKNTI